MSPLPPLRSGIADYTHELLAPLEAHFEVVTYAPRDASRAIAGPHAAVLFQLGNDPLHEPSVAALAKKRTMPAVVVLHDFVLHHLFAAAYLDTGRTAEYVAALEKAHGERGRALGERNVYGPRLPVWDLDPWAFPLSRGVLLDADAVLVHSRLVRGAVLRARPGLFCVEVPHHVVPAPETPKPEARERLGIPRDRFVVATLGVVTPA
ncbi:MAG: hypothetical protein JNK60_20520, partial [Acidobacteria bacterium]|nr:hypothetical protein [Acidobacteriota bacterium]